MTVFSPPPRKEDLQNEEGKGKKCAGNDDKIPSRYCKYCGMPIRWEVFKSVKTIHPESLYHWQRKEIENWVPADFYTGEKHHCRHHYRIDKEEVAA
jgi:hypothetical protein